MTKRTRKLSRICAFFILAFFYLTVLEPAVEHNSVFSLSGNGSITISDSQTQEAVTVEYRNKDGAYNEEALNQIDQLLRCHGEGETHPISLKLIELLDNVEDHFASDGITVTSGYRSPAYNLKLKKMLRRVSTESLHTQGMAVDIVVAGVDKGELVKYVRSLDVGGVGDYRRVNAIHLDVGPIRNW